MCLTHNLILFCIIMISDAPGGKCPGERKHLASFPGLPRRREDFLREKKMARNQRRSIGPPWRSVACVVLPPRTRWLHHSTNHLRNSWRKLRKWSNMSNQIKNTEIFDLNSLHIHFIYLKPTNKQRNKDDMKFHILETSSWILNDIKRRI